MKTIVFPTDFTESSEQFFPLVCSIARAEGAEIIVLHAIASELTCESDRDEGDVVRDSALYEQYWQKFLRLRQLAGDVPLSFQLKVGVPVNVILSVARHESCELIAISAPHRHAVCGEDYRTIPACIMRLASCPVLSMIHPNPLANSQRLPESLFQPASSLTQ